MEPITISAKFAAYTYFTGSDLGKNASQQEAVRFSEENWQRFLGCAHKGLGRLLSRLATQRKPRASQERHAACR